MVLPTRSLTGKSFLGLGALVCGLAGGILILLGTVNGGPDVVRVLLGLAVLYGTYLMYRARTGILFRGTRARTGAFLNLAIGLLTLLVPGGVGGEIAVLVLLSGFLGFLAA